MGGPEHTHVRPAAPAAQLDVLGGAVEDAHEGHWPRSLAARRAHDVPRGRRREKEKPVHPPVLWMSAMDLSAPNMESMLSSTGTTKHALR
jgi:hypothetical protein